MPPQKPQNSNHYDDSPMIRIEPREHVRKRPGMYIGGMDKRALHHLLFQLLNDPISEFENTSNNHIVITLLPNNTISVADDGIGISVEISEQFGISMLEAHFTMIGQHGFGRLELNAKSLNPYRSPFSSWITWVMNALSTFCEVEVKRDGYLWRQHYHQGVPSAPVQQVRPLDKEESTGTSITFQPDFSILEENDFDFELIANHCQQLAYLLPQLRFTVLDKRETERELSYYHPQGLVEWVKFLAEEEKPVSDILSIHHECELFDRVDNPYSIQVQIALQWLATDEEKLKGFVNTEETQDGGYHLEGLEMALKKHLKIRRWNKLGKGLVAVIHILHPNPIYVGLMTRRLISLDVITAVDEAIEALFAAHPEAKAAIQAHFASHQ